MRGKRQEGMVNGSGLDFSVVLFLLYYRCVTVNPEEGWILNLWRT